MPDLFNHPTGALHQVDDSAKIIEFILAGKSKFTLRSDKTGQHYTYKVQKGDTAVWFVKRLARDNHYVYLGTIFDGQGFRATDKTSRWTQSFDEAFKVFTWFWPRLNSNGLPQGVSFFHTGRCGMCGVELTDPISVAEGYGPDCRKKKLRHGMMHDRKTA